MADDAGQSGCVGCFARCLLHRHRARAGSEPTWGDTHRSLRWSRISRNGPRSGPRAWLRSQFLRFGESRGRRLRRRKVVPLVAFSEMEARIRPWRSGPRHESCTHSSRRSSPRSDLYEPAATPSSASRRTPARSSLGADGHRRERGRKPAVHSSRPLARDRVPHPLHPASCPSSAVPQAILPQSPYSPFGSTATTTAQPTKLTSERRMVGGACSGSGGRGGSSRSFAV